MIFLSFNEGKGYVNALNDATHGNRLQKTEEVVVIIGIGNSADLFKQVVYCFQGQNLTKL